jgi:beta-galactosidase/beta-glucuronidase
VQSLAGEWRFQTDPGNTGVRESWYRQKFPDSLLLPGSLETNGKGALNTEYSAQSLSRKYDPQPGGVWYQREIEILRSWAGRRVALYLERASTSRVWLDGREAGEAQTSRRAPHLHELGDSISPGRHTLNLLTGSALPGRIELQVTDRVWVRELRAASNPARKVARVTAEVANTSGGVVKGSIRFAARSFNGSRTHEPPALDLPFQTSPGRQRLEGELAMGDSMLLWDEFHPALYRLTVTLRASDGSTSYADRAETSFGMREVSSLGGKLQINGRRLFLRGRCDGGNISPMTGQPPF